MLHDKREGAVLVLGVGNLLLSDAGLGVRALEQLAQTSTLPAGVQLLDGGTQGLHLLPYLEAASSVLILDAVQRGQPPGTLVRLDGDDIIATLAQTMSLHQVGLNELLAVCRLRGTSPSRLVVWGIEPAQIAWSTELSPQVAAALPYLVAAARDEVGTWLAGLPYARAQQQTSALI
jgi:hydrogenase maturation protease